jgi:hypothetical protein
MMFEHAVSIFRQLPTTLKNTDPADIAKLARQDVVGTAFASMLIGAGIKPSDFKSRPDSESYLREGHSHTSEMHIWHFHASTRADRDEILGNFARLLLEQS